MSYVSLHTHTHYSLLDGLSTAEELVKAAKDFGQPAIACTDHGTLSGLREMHKECLKQGVKFIPGVEAYFSPTDRFDRRPVSKRDDNTALYNHLIIHAKNEQGFENLHKMSREAWESGFYHKPRVDMDLLKEYSDGLVVLSGCLNSVMAKALENDDMLSAKLWALDFQEIFGENFYVEVQPHNPQEINEGLLKIADELSISPVVTTDCHFTRPEQRWINEALLILSTKPKKAKGMDYNKTKNMEIFERFNKLYPERPISFEKLDVFLMSRDEAFKRMAASGIDRQDIYDNTLKIADEVENIPLPRGLEVLPEVDEPDKTLRERVYANLNQMDVPQEYYERADRELDVVSRKSFSNYFLVVEDVVNWAKNNEIPVGPGRGSSAGSLICYALNITEVDPIEHGLLFERFLDEEREDFPDIDTDFSVRRRHEVKEYLTEKYGNAATISNFAYFKDKQVVKDASKVLGVPFKEADDALKTIESWEEYLHSSVTKAFREKYPMVTELAKHLRGRIKSVGQHAAGVVVSRRPLEEFAPIETRTDKEDKVSGRGVVIALDMEESADLGLVKLDVLGLNALDIIDDAKRLAGVKKIPYGDPEVYRQLSEGNTLGAFQAEQRASTSLIQEMGVGNFKELVASNALVRPGARNTIGEDYIARKHGEPYKAIHERVEPYMEETYGLPLYQEQVMKICTELGGLSGSEANEVRHIIGKKLDPRLFDQFRNKFIEGASEYIGEKAAGELWASFEEHSNYSFAKAHAVCYSLLTEQTMWLKINHPLAFYTSMLWNISDKDERTDLFLDMKRAGVKLLLPHINKSDDKAKIEGDAIRLGLTDIKFISDKVYAKLKGKTFDSYEDVVKLSKTKYSGVNSRAVDAMNAVGALDFPDNPRGDVQDNLYEYLSIPVMDAELPWQAEENLSKLRDFNENDAFIFHVFVRKIKRAKTWSRVEVFDQTGSAGIFDTPDTELTPGKQYIILVASNSIVEWIPAEDFEFSTHTFVRLMQNKVGIPKGKYMIVSEKKRFTKKREMMATIVVANYKQEIRGALVFPRLFGKVAGKIKEGYTGDMNFKRLSDGGLMLREIT